MGILDVPQANYGQEIASAEVQYAFLTSYPISPATAAYLIGASIVVPPNTGPIEITYGCTTSTIVSGGGTVQLQLRELANPSVVIDHTDYPVVAAITSATAAGSGYYLPLRSRPVRFETSTSTRTFYLGHVLVRDSASSLTASIRNDVDAPTYIRAVAA